MAGFLNPVLFLFDHRLAEKGILQVRHSLPYSDLNSLPREECRQFIEKGVPLEFGHTLEDQLGGQTSAGFFIKDFYEDRHRTHPAAKFTPTYIATLAIKPQRLDRVS